MSESSSPFHPDALTERGKNLLISISGIRGVIPTGLDPIHTTCFARAFAAVTGKRIVVGEDARPTGPALKQILIGTLIASGKTVIDVGLAPTPTVKAAVALHGDAGVMISASHNPLEWNGFKLIQKGGFFFDAAMSAKWSQALRDNVESAVAYQKFGEVRRVDGVQDHIKAVLKALPLLKQIRAKKYRVVVDAVAGAGREALPMLLEELGCKVERLYCAQRFRQTRPPAQSGRGFRAGSRRGSPRNRRPGYRRDQRRVHPAPRLTGTRAVSAEETDGETGYRLKFIDRESVRFSRDALRHSRTARRGRRSERRRVDA